MKRHLRHYVKNDLFGGQNPPPVTNRRYHPKNVDVRNNMYKATVKQMLSKVDQENLEENIKGWKQESPEDFLFFRRCSPSPTEAVSDNTSDTDSNVEAHVTQTLFHAFAHQTAWQRHLMSRYGNEIMLLDATCKTMRYELPLFFLVLKRASHQKVPLPVRRKRNAFASRVVERASIMQNHYFVNVPVDANIYVKKKSRKRTQQRPLMPHFIKKQPTGKKPQL